MISNILIFNQIRNVGDILVIPGGPGIRKYDLSEIIVFVKSNASNYKYVFSICTGAFILAKSQIIKNKKATTHYSLAKELQNPYLGD